MIKFEKIPETIMVDCSEHGAGPFSVLVVPASNAPNDKLRNFLLIHPQYGIIHYMFGCNVDNNEEAAKLAFYNAMNYIPDFLRECFENE